MKDLMTEQEIIQRKIFLKRQLIDITKKEIEHLENSLNQSSFTQTKINGDNNAN